MLYIAIAGYLLPKRKTVRIDKLFSVDCNINRNGKNNELTKT